MVLSCGASKHCHNSANTIFCFLHTQQPLRKCSEVVPWMSAGRLNAASRGYPIQGEQCIHWLEMLTEASVRGKSPWGSSALVRGWWPPLAPLTQEGALCHLGKPKDFFHSHASLKGKQ